MENQIVSLMWKNLDNAPAIFWAGLILLAGVLAAGWLGNLATAFFGRLRINQVLRRMGIEESLARIDITLNAPRFFGDAIKWFIIFVSLTAFFEVLGFAQLSDLLGKVVTYFPNIFVALFIFIVAVFLVDFSKKIIVGTLEKERVVYSRFLGRIIAWAIWVLAILAILYQLKIVPTLILTIFVGFTAIIVLILGISFGLAGKESAAKIIKELEEKLK